MTHDLIPVPRMEGITHCRRCGGGEGALPLGCPGVRLTPAHFDAIHGGRLDFVDGRWVNKGLRDTDDLIVRAQAATSAAYPDLPYVDALVESRKDLYARFATVDPAFARGYYAGVRRATSDDTVGARIRGGDVLLHAGKVLSLQHVLEELQRG